MQLRLSLVSMLLLVPALRAQGNEKVMFNDAHASGTTRVTPTLDNVLYFVPPARFRFGYGNVTGVTVTVRDTDQSTAETMFVGFVNVNASGVPDPTRSISVAQFTGFGSGTGAATLSFRVSLATPIRLPARSAQVVVLPMQKSASDVTTVRYQDGNSLKLPTGVTPGQWTYFLDGATVKPFLTAGTTLDIGGLYTEPVVGLVNRSNAYSSVENLEGPESLFHDSSRGDAFGYYLRYEAFKNQFAIVGVANDRLATPVNTQFGDVLLGTVGFSVLPLPIALDGNGFGRSGTIVIPSGLKVTFWSQATFLDFANLNVRTSDAVGTQTF